MDQFRRNESIAKALFIYFFSIKENFELLLCCFQRVIIMWFEIETSWEEFDDFMFNVNENKKEKCEG